LTVLAVVVNGMVGAAAGSHPPTGTGAGGLGALPTLHLWFLLLLMEIVLAVMVVRALLVRLLGPVRAAHLAERIGGVLSAPWGPLLIAVPYAAGLLVQPGGVSSLTEPYTLLPVAGA